LRRFILTSLEDEIGLCVCPGNREHRAGHDNPRAAGVRRFPAAQAGVDRSPYRRS